MATAVFVPPSPHDSFSNMSVSTRRAALASIPNVTNSPHRFLNTSSSKRPRSLAGVTQQENEPPSKKQMVERPPTTVQPLTPRQQVQASEARIFERGDGLADNAFRKKLVAARDKGYTSTRVLKHTAESQSIRENESIRQWQKHTRKAFPTYSFYFESIPEETQARFARQVISLGAREEKFFSKTVTHIVTTRQILPEVELSKPLDSNNTIKGGRGDEVLTINPSLLDKNAAGAAPSLRNHAVISNVNTRRDGVSNMDILTRGRQMGMKIWPVEKFQRVLLTLLDDGGATAHNSRSIQGGLQTTRTQREDLSQVLRNEKTGVSSERELGALFRDLILFKGPFIYVHDMDEKVKPTMVREYPKVARRQDGEWPQFRSAPAGKCPFIEEPMSKRDLDQERAREKSLLAQQRMEVQPVTRTRAATAAEQARMEPPCKPTPRKPLQEMVNVTAGSVLTSTTSRSAATLPPKAERQTSLSSMPERPPINCMRPPFVIQVGGEPCASGIQRSNVTSAIQSQVISSTAAAPGAKAGTSKEVHELKRKVLERGHTGSLSIGSVPSSHRMTDLAGALKDARAPAPQRAAKSRAQEKLGGIQEETEQYAEGRVVEQMVQAASKRKKPVKREAKPGYCENCRDKYEDFELHIASRKHRKFALTASNWVELDALLAKLQEP